MQEERSRVFQLARENAANRRRAAMVEQENSRLREQIANKNEQYQAILRECKRVKIVNARRTQEVRALSSDAKTASLQLSEALAQNGSLRQEMRALVACAGDGVALQEIATKNQELAQRDEAIQLLQRELSNRQADDEIQRVFDAFDGIQAAKARYLEELVAMRREYRILQQDLSGLGVQIYKVSELASRLQTAQARKDYSESADKYRQSKSAVEAQMQELKHENSQLKQLNGKIQEKLRQAQEKVRLDPSIYYKRAEIAEKQVSELRALNQELAAYLEHQRYQAVAKVSDDMADIDREIDSLPFAKSYAETKYDGLDFAEDHYANDNKAIPYTSSYNAEKAQGSLVEQYALGSKQRIVHSGEDNMESGNLTLSALSEQPYSHSSGHALAEQLPSAMGHCETSAGPQHDYLLAQSEIIYNIATELTDVRLQLAEEMRRFASHFEHSQTQIDTMMKQLLDDQPRQEIKLISNYDEREIDKMWENNRTMSQYLRTFVQVDKIMIKYLRKYSEQMGNDGTMAEDMQQLILRSAELENKVQRHEQRIAQLQRENESLKATIPCEYNGTAAVSVTAQQYEDREKLFASKYDQVAFEKEALKDTNEQLEQRIVMLQLETQESRVIIEQLEAAAKAHTSERDQEKHQQLYDECASLKAEIEELHNRNDALQFPAPVYTAVPQELSFKEKILQARSLRDYSGLSAEGARYASATAEKAVQTILAAADSIAPRTESRDPAKGNENEALRYENSALLEKIARIKERGAGDLTVSQLAESQLLQQSQNAQYLLMIYELKHQNNLLKLKIESMLGPEQ